MDRIARSGKLGGTIEKVEAATAAALQRRRRAPIQGLADKVAAIFVPVVLAIAYVHHGGGWTGCAGGSTGEKCRGS